MDTNYDMTRNKLTYAQILLPSNSTILFCALSILKIFCAGAEPHEPEFFPQSNAELKNAVDACLQIIQKDTCSTGPHGLGGAPWTARLRTRTCTGLLPLAAPGPMEALGPWGPLRAQVALRNPRQVCRSRNSVITT